MAPPVSEELTDFHSVDRKIYTRLLLQGFDPHLSMEIVAFWYLLDILNHYQIMKGKIELMGDWEFTRLAKDSIACWKCIQTDSNFTTYDEFEWLFWIVPNFRLVMENKEQAMEDMKVLLNEVCEKAFCDIKIIPEGDRSLFLTFSKGYPVSEKELRTGLNFEDRVEKIQMIDLLSARMVVKTPADVKRIVGYKGRRRFKVNGKDVWVRQWHPK